MKISILALLCACSCANALAQWQWTDDNGRPVFSDLPPPAQLPPARIIRSPAGNAQAPAATDSAADKAAHAKTQKSAPEPMQHEAAETAQNAKDRAQQAQLRQENCKRARTALATLADGRLLAHTNAQGERAFMDDSTRAAERQRAQKMIRAHCGPADSH